MRDHGHQMVTKTDVTPRFDAFQRLNDITCKHAYPLPRREDNLDTTQEHSLFYSTLDLLSGFWQVEMAPEDRDKTAFTYGGGGLYRFFTMPFGLCNAPATFPTFDGASSQRIAVGDCSALH